MYSKVLFVGLGGSGGKTLRFIKREMNRWLDEHGYEDGIPAGWQFLWIDTPTQPDGGDIDAIADRLEDTEYLGLVHQGASLQNFINALDVQEDATNELRTWRLNPSTIPVPVDKGAGQFRAIGQSIALASVRKMKEAFDKSLASINADGDSELSALYTKIHGAPPAGFQNQTNIIIISSLSGGTGAGLLNTVSDILRVHTDSNAGDNIFGFLYTPEVFSTLGDAAIGGVQANSLAAVSELLNGYWWAGNTGVDQDGNIHAASNRPIPAALLRSAGLANPLAKSGPEYPFLVGRVGAAGVDHENPESLFQLVGRSLVSLITEKNAGDGFFPFIVGNYAQAAIAPGVNNTDVLVNPGGLEEGGTPPFQAIGFSRVSLGTDYFEKYTIQRIAKDALSHLLRWHAASPSAQIKASEMQTNDQERITLELAKPFLPTFLTQAGISEFGADDQILDSLIPDESDDLAREAISNAQRLSGIGTDEKKPISDWKIQIRDALSQVLRDYDVKYYTALNSKAQTWVKDEVQEKISGAIENLLANAGLEVTETVCRLAASYMRTETYDDLINRDLAAAQKTFSEVNQYGVDQAFGGSEGKIEATHELIDQAIKTGVRGILLSGSIQRIKMAAELCTHLADSVLIPAANAIRDASVITERDYRTIDDYPEWNDSSPPVSVHPPEGDYSLIEPSTYPATFKKLLSETTELEGDGDVRTEVRSDVISGRFLKKDSVDEKIAKRFYCVKYSQRWWPREVLGGDPTQNSTNAVFEISVSVHEIEARVKEWLTRDGTSFAKYLKVSLRDYLGSQNLFKDNDLTEAEIQANRETFINSCTDAVNAAAPLLKIDNQLLNTVHPGYVGAKNHVFMSDIPLENHPLSEDIETRLLTIGLDSRNFNFVNDQTIKHIDITTVLPGPHSILLAESLLAPIAGAWGAAENYPEDFWSLRRSQRLERFVPTPQSILLSMLRGWIIAGLLGHLDRSGKPIRIRRKDIGTEVNFPNPVLSRETGRMDDIGLTLEALPLAYLKCSTLANLSPLEPYIELRDLGLSPAASSVNEYSKFHADISHWIETGEVEKSISDPILQSIVISLPDDASVVEKVQARAGALKEKLQISRQRYSEIMDDRIDEERQTKLTVGQGPLWLGLHSMLDRAHEDLIQAAENAAGYYDDDTSVVA